MLQRRYLKNPYLQLLLFVALLIFSLFLVNGAQSWVADREVEDQDGKYQVLLPAIFTPGGVDIEGPFVSKLVDPVIYKGNLDTLPVSTASQGQGPLRVGDPAVERTLTFGGVSDPVLQDLAGLRQVQGKLGEPILNFDGIRTGSNPHDPVGDVGPDHYIQMVNSAFQIFDKAGNSLAGPLAINSLWVAAGATGQCALNNSGDPIVLYDPMEDRWLMSQFTGKSNSQECIAISRSGNPVNGGWNLYEFELGTFSDYPKLGVWPDGYYMGANQGTTAPVFVFDRANMLNGNPASFVQFDISGLSGMNGNVLLPSDLDGAAPPPAGSPNYFYRQVDGDNFGGFDRVELFSFSVDWGNPAASTLTGPVNIALADFDSDLCGFFSYACVPQPGGGDLLDPVNEWPMWRLQYRNFGAHEAMVSNFVVDVDGSDNAGIRWFELRKSGGSNWTLYQQGTYAPEYPEVTSFEHRWMGSIAMDKAGNIALGYSVSSSTNVSPSIRYAGRVNRDPLGLLPQGEITLIDGEGTINSNRWGDYSSMNVDPTDGCTFWYTNDYVNAANQRQSRIGTFRFASCTSTDLAIVKGDTPDPVMAGEKLAYDITVYNNGGEIATNVLVTDTLPAGVSYDTDTDSCAFSAGTGPGGADQLICSLGDIPSGASESFTIQVTVDSDLLAGGGSATSITNQVTVAGDQAEVDGSDNTATTVTIVNELADLRVSKDCKPDQPVDAGQEAICTITIENLGPSLARNVEAIDDHLSDGTFNFGAISPATCTATPNPQEGSGTVTCDLGDLDAGDRLKVTVPMTADGPFDINDRVTVAGDTPDPDHYNNEDEDSVTVTALADLAISKTAFPDPVVAGELLTYTLVITNYGPSTAYNVMVEDVLPAAVQIESITPSVGACQAGVPGDADLPTRCALGNMDANAVETIVIVVTVSSGGGGSMQNDAWVYSDSEDPDKSNNFASTGTFVEGFVDLRVVKVASPDPVIAGELLLYEITVYNDGGLLATNVTLTDTLPTGVTYNTNTDSCTFSAGTGSGGEDQLFCDLGDIPGSESVSFTIQVTVDSDYVAGSGGSSTLTNHVVVSSDQGEPNFGNNRSTTTTIVNDLADLRVSKDCKPDRPLDAGEEAICTITVENLGPSTARNVLVVDAHVSDGIFSFGDVATGSGTCSSTPNPQDGSGTVTCNLGKMAAGATVVITVPVSADGPYDINDRVTVSSDTPDPNPDNNQAEDTIIVTAVADLAITKTDSPDPVNAGEQLTYVLEITNHGPSTAFNTVVEDVTPDGVTIDSATASSGECQAGDPGDASLPTICALGNLLPDAVETVEIVVTVLPDSSGLLQNDAEVYSESDDPDNANNLASATTRVRASADLAVTKVDSPDPVFAGERLVYDVKIVNYGPSSAPDVQLLDTLPPQVSYMGATISNGTGTCVLLEIPPNTVSCDINDLDPGEFVRVVIDTLVNINVPDGAVISNEATVWSAVSDPNMDNNTTTASTTVRTQADLEIFKNGDIDVTNPSWMVKYTLEVVNHGTSDAQDVVVIDDLPLTPKKVVYVFDTGNGACRYDESLHRVTCEFGTLDAGDSVSVHIYVDVKGSVGLITNIATVSSTTYDKDMSNNTARKDLYFHG